MCNMLKVIGLSFQRLILVLYFINVTRLFVVINNLVLKFNPSLLNCTNLNQKAQKTDNMIPNISLLSHCRVKSSLGSE